MGTAVHHNGGDEEEGLTELWEPASPRLRIYIPAVPRPSIGSRPTSAASPLSPRFQHQHHQYLDPAAGSPPAITAANHGPGSRLHPPGGSGAEATTSPHPRPGSAAPGSAGRVGAQVPSSRLTSMTCAAGGGGAGGGSGSSSSPRHSAILSQVQPLQARTAAAAASQVSSSPPGALGTGAGDPSPPALLMVRSIQPSPHQPCAGSPSAAAAAARARHSCVAESPSPQLPPDSVASLSAGLAAARRPAVPWLGGASALSPAPWLSSLPDSPAGSFSGGARPHLASLLGGQQQPVGHGGVGLVFGESLTPRGTHANSNANDTRHHHHQHQHHPKHRVGGGGSGGGDFFDDGDSDGGYDGWDSSRELIGSAATAAAHAMMVAAEAFGRGSGGGSGSAPSSPRGALPLGLRGGGGRQAAFSYTAGQTHHPQLGGSPHVAYSSSHLRPTLHRHQPLRTDAGAARSPRGSTASVLAAAARPRSASVTTAARPRSASSFSVSGRAAGSRGGSSRPTSALGPRPPSLSLSGAGGSAPGASIAAVAAAAAASPTAAFEIVPDGLAASLGMTAGGGGSFSGGVVGVAGTGRVGRAIAGILPGGNPGTFSLGLTERINLTLMDAGARPPPQPAAPPPPNAAVNKMLHERQEAESQRHHVESTFSSANPSAWMHQMLVVQMEEQRHSAAPAQVVPRHTSTEPLHLQSMSYLASKEACRTLAASTRPGGAISLREAAYGEGTSGPRSASAKSAKR